MGSQGFTFQNQPLQPPSSEMSSQLLDSRFAEDKRHGNVNRRGSSLMEMEGFAGKGEIPMDRDSDSYRDFKPARPVIKKIDDSLSFVDGEKPRPKVRRGSSEAREAEEELPWNQKPVSAKAEFKKNRDGMGFMKEGDVDYTPESGSLVDFKPARPVINRIADSGIEAGGKAGKQF